MPADRTVLSGRGVDDEIPTPVAPAVIPDELAALFARWAPHLLDDSPETQRKEAR